MSRHVLTIGSSALGWQEFGDDAALRTMTKAMPGGDGSLEFSLPGDVAWKYRNVIAPEARVILRYDGQPVYGGRLSCDPLRHRIGSQDTLTISATGLWGMAARDTRWGYLAVDGDYGNWMRTRSVYDSSDGEVEPLEDTGKFEADTEGRLFIKADRDRTFDDYANARLNYWLFNGLLSGATVVRIGFDYKCCLTAEETSGHLHWKFQIRSCANPWSSTSVDEFSQDTTQSTWQTDQYVDMDTPNACISVRLVWDAGPAASYSRPTEPAPYVWLKNVKVYGRLSGASPDTSVTIADILADCATQLGVTTTRITGLTTAPDEFVCSYPSTVASVIEQAVLLESSPVEAYFDLSPTGAEQFTANSRPSSVDATRNRLWVVGDRGGEDLSELVRDWEATPEQVEVIYRIRSEATLPNGTVESTTYPASTTSSFPLVEIVDATGEPFMTAARAATYAQSIYTARQENLYSGDVSLLDTALTSTGTEVATVLLRPGDRIAVPHLVDVPAEGLYVQATEYDFETGTCTATVGEPWDAVGYARLTPKAGKTPAVAHDYEHQPVGGRGPNR